MDVGFNIQQLSLGNKIPFEFSHQIEKVTLSPNFSFEIDNKVLGVVLYIFEGEGVLSGTCEKKIERDQVICLPANKPFQISSDKAHLKFLQIKSQMIIEPKSSDCYLITAINGFKFENELGKFFLRDLLHPDFAPVSIPFCVGDTEIQKGNTAPANKWKITGFHFVTEGAGEVCIEGKERIPLQEGSFFISPRDILWQTNSASDTHLKYVSVLDKFWKEEYRLPQGE